jgi:hypothetical protein
MASDINLRTYSDPAVVAAYAKREKLELADGQISALEAL